MKIVVLGASGMLGCALMAEGQGRGHEMTGERVELTDGAALKAHLEKHQPDLVINSAALTDLRRCEADARLAYAINAKPVEIMAQYRLIQISSDQCQGELFNEYARSKWYGECYAMDGLVIRTNIVGLNNMGWAIEAIENDSPVTLFDDYHTSSIDIWSFSEILFDLLEQHPGETGILNIASKDTVSKKEFVEALAGRMGKKLTNAKAGSVKDLLPKRNLNNRLDVSRIEGLLNRKMPDLNKVVNSLAERRNLCTNQSRLAIV
jgi:dTDP-4-dehydrorhamnose reductase